MSIRISNVTDLYAERSGPDTYTVSINNKPVIAVFEHERSDGLAACLRKAAEAVENATLSRGKE